VPFTRQAILSDFSHFAGRNGERDFHKWVKGSFDWNVEVSTVQIQIQDPVVEEKCIWVSHPVLEPSAILNELFRKGEAHFRNAFFGGLTPEDVDLRWDLMSAEEWVAKHPHLQVTLSISKLYFSDCWAVGNESRGPSPPFCTCVSKGGVDVLFRLFKPSPASLGFPNRW
jgi:hypothetical protein